MITAEQISRTRSNLKLSGKSQDRDDNIRIAYEWLDAQRSMTILLDGKMDLRSLIGEWGGCEVSQNEIDVAAALPTEMAGSSYHLKDASPHLTLPSAERLRGIKSAYSQDFPNGPLLDQYTLYEIVKYIAKNGRSLVRLFDCEAFPDLLYDRDEFCAKNDDCKCYYCVYGS